MQALKYAAAKKNTVIEPSCAVPLAGDLGHTAAGQKDNQQNTTVGKVRRNGGSDGV